MSRWWRAYDEAVDDPKLQTLPPATAWGWFNLMCLASANGGTLPTTEAIAFKLRISVGKAGALVTTLRERGLIDEHEDGTTRPHNWDGRQFKTDNSSNERVKRYREKRSAAGLLAQWQPSRAMREAVYSKDGHVCVYCGASKDLTIDHKTPEIRGGSHDNENLQTACRVCNAQKRDMTHEEYLERNVHVTLHQREMKRAQSTEAETEKKKDSEARASGAGAPVYADPVHALWGEGVAILGQLGVKEASARSNIGRWLRDNGSDPIALLGVIQRAREQNVIDPVAWVTKAIKIKGFPNAPENKSVHAGIDRVLERMRQFDEPGGGGGPREGDVRLLSQGRR